MKSLTKRIASIFFALVCASAPIQSYGQSGPRPYWDPGDGMAIPVPALYFFREDGTGVRTTYPQGGQLQFGQPYPFAWALQDNVVVLQFASGYTDMFELTGYDEATDTIQRVGIGRSQQLGQGPWFGCASGQIPPMIATSLC
jgi:hypothetical protein